MKTQVSFQDYAIVACGTLNMELNYLKDSGTLDARKIIYTKPGRHEVPRELESQLIRQIGMAAVRYLKKAALLLPVIMLLLLSTSCNKSADSPSVATTNQSETSEVSNGVSLPEEILANLPVYPGAKAITPEESEFKPFSTPLSPQVEGRPPNIVYETVSARYTAQARSDKILDWYKGKLGAKGYWKYTDVIYNGPGGYDVHSMGFYRPEQLLISVEVHVYDVPDNPIFVLLANHDTTTSPEPPEPPLPDDINRIEINYSGDNGSVPETEIIIDKGDIQKLVGIINDLPLLPDAPIVPVSTLLSMVLHSSSEGDINLSYHLSLSDYTLVRIPDRSTLHDNKSRLLEAVQRLLDIKS